MGWIRNVVRAVTPPVIVAAVDIARGKPVGQALAGAATAPIALPVAAAAAAARVAAGADRKLEALEAKLIEKVAGRAARNFFLDVKRVINPWTDVQAISGYLGSVEQFVNTLDPSYLNPTVGYLAAEIQRTRDACWEAGAAIPPAVVTLMPTDLADAARSARHVPVAAANTLSLPAFAIEHFDRASAITLIDLIFFRHAPGSATADDRHFWAHELAHVTQYRSLGLQEFARRYISGLFAEGIHPLEREADLTACRHFPGGRPHYIGACP